MASCSVASQVGPELSLAQGFVGANAGGVNSVVGEDCEGVKGVAVIQPEDVNVLGKGEGGNARDPCAFAVRERTGRRWRWWWGQVGRCERGTRGWR
jgi:hypothetical protein